MGLIFLQQWPRRQNYVSKNSALFKFMMRTQFIVILIDNGLLLWFVYFGLKFGIGWK